MGTNVMKKTAELPVRKARGGEAEVSRKASLERIARAEAKRYRETLEILAK